MVSCGQKQTQGVCPVSKKTGAPIMFHPCERDFLGKMTSPVDLGIVDRVRLRQ
jgi:hypothetical protein